VLMKRRIPSTIVSTSLPRIGSDFNEFTIALWVANAYNLAYGAFCKSAFVSPLSEVSKTNPSLWPVPLFGSCNDIFGRKCTLLAGIGFFLVGSVLCGVASVCKKKINCGRDGAHY
jgi:MFS family permease